MGSNQGNYSQQINTALNQANTPKSPLAQQLSGTLQGLSGGILSSLANAGSLGNAFPGYASGASSPGSIQNGGGFQFANIASNLSPNNPASTNNSPVNNSGSTGQNTGGLNSGVYPNIPGYNGGFNPMYSNIGGVDLSPYIGQGLKMSDLISKGILTQDQVNKQFNYDPTTNTTASPGFQDALNGTSLDAFSPNSQSGLSAALANLGSVNTSGPNGQTGPERYLQNGVYTDGSGNTIGYQGSNGMQSSPASNGANGNLVPSFNSSGVNTSSGTIPGISQANPNIQGLNLQGMNPQALQQLMNMSTQSGVQGNNNVNGLNLNSLAQALQGMAGGASNSNQINVDSSQINPQDSPYYQATAQVLQNQMNQQRADLRARYDLNGNGLGTAGSYAESQFDAQMLPQMASTLGSLQQNDFQNQLAQRNQIQSGNIANAAANNANLNSLSSLFGNTAGVGLGQNQLASQNANNVLGNQLGFQTNQNNAVNSQNNILSQLAQFNSGQTNTMNQNYAQMQQSANQSQINNQFTGLQNLAQILAQFGLAGIPGGSANVSLGGQSQSPIQQATGILGALGSF